MKWPFGREEKRKKVPPVDYASVLTDEEQQECQGMWRSLTRTNGGSYAVKDGLADSLKRSVIALCMMGRAERFLIEAGCGSLRVPLTAGQDHRPECAERACQAAAKACSIFPLSIYFYDFACVLRQAGKQDEAKRMFAEFLSRVETEALDPIMRTFLKQRDVEGAVQHAREMT